MIATIKVCSATKGSGYYARGPGLDGVSKLATAGTPLQAARRCALLMLGLPPVQSTDDNLEFESEHGIDLRHISSRDDAEFFQLVATEPAPEEER